MGYRREQFTLSVAFAISRSKKRKGWGSAGSDLWQSRAAPEYGKCGPGKTTFTIDCRHTDAAVLRDSPNS